MSKFLSSLLECGLWFLFACGLTVPLAMSITIVADRFDRSWVNDGPLLEAAVTFASLTIAIVSFWLLEWRKRLPENRRQAKFRRQSGYRVVIRNDDSTPSGFVMDLLRQFFGKTHLESAQLASHIHRRDAGICGVFDSYEAADARLAEVRDFVRRQGQSLQCTLETP